METQSLIDSGRHHFVVSPDGKLLAGITSDSDNRNTRIQVLQRS
ncbi:hypothetical protein [Anabaena sp. CCY 9910]